MTFFELVHNFSKEKWRRDIKHFSIEQVLSGLEITLSSPFPEEEKLLKVKIEFAFPLLENMTKSQFVANQLTWRHDFSKNALWSSHLLEVFSGLIKNDEINQIQIINFNLSPTHANRWLTPFPDQGILTQPFQENKQLRYAYFALHVACQEYFPTVNCYSLRAFILDYSKSIQRQMYWPEIVEATLKKFDSWEDIKGSKRIDKVKKKSRNIIITSITMEESDLLREVEHSSYENVEFILSNNRNLNINFRLRRNFNRTLLHIAVQKGCFKTTSLLLQYGADGDIRDDFGCTPLHYACKSGGEKIVRLLIKPVQRLYEENLEGLNALDVAAYNGWLNIVEILLNEGNYKVTRRADKSRKSALHYACQKRRLRVAEYLLEKNNNGKDFKDEEERTPLFYAVEAGDDDMVTILLEKGSSIKQTDKNNMTPLHIACKYGFVEITKAILATEEGKTIVNSTVKNQTNPLFLAIDNDHSEIADLLFQNEYGNVESLEGERVNENEPQLEDDKGETPMHLASYSGSVKAIQYLCLKGFNPKTVDSSERTTLHHAMINGAKIDMIQYLLQQCQVNVNARDKRKQTALHLAAKYNKEKDIIVILINYGADTNAKDVDDRAPLHLAASNGSHTVLVVLIEYKVVIDVKDVDNRTPLHYACQNGHSDSVNFLTESGANIAAHDNFGVSPSVLALNGNHNDIVEKFINCEYGNENKLQLLKGAIFNGNTNIVKKILASLDNMDKEKVVENAECMLFVAFARNHADILNHLEDFTGRKAHFEETYANENLKEDSLLSVLKFVRNVPIYNLETLGSSSPTQINTPIPNNEVLLQDLEMLNLGTFCPFLNVKGDQALDLSSFNFIENCKLNCRK